MWVRRTEVGRPGIFKRPVCVLDMVAPSGRATPMMLLVVVMSSRLFKTLKKWAVVPESMTVVVSRGGEGVDCVDVRVLLVILYY
jgi:hypothetical protein